MILAPESGAGLVDELRQWLRPYQLELITDTAHERIVLKARQVGISDAIALEMVLVSAGLHPAVLTHNCVIVSKTERDAYDVVDKARAWVQRLRLIPELRPFLETSRDTASEIRFKQSGFRIVSQAQSKDAGRSQTGHLYLDEYAFYVWQRDIWTGATPATESLEGLRITLVSTPNGTGDHLYEVWSDRRKYAGWSRHKIDIYDAAAQGFPVDIDKMRRKYTAAQWAQEFECDFLGSETRLFSLEMLQEAHGVIASPIAFERRYLGIDTASVVDLSAAVIVDEHDTGIWIGDAYFVERVPYGTDHVRSRVGQDVIFDALIRHLEPNYSVIDTTGDRARKNTLGVGLYPRLLKSSDEPQSLISKIITSDFKDSGTEKLRDMVQTRDVMFHADRKDYVYSSREAARFLDVSGQVPIQSISEFIGATFEVTEYPMLVKDFQKIERKWSGPNKSIIDAKRDEHGHGDGYWAALMAVMQLLEDSGRRESRKRTRQSAGDIKKTLRDAQRRRSSRKIW